MLLTVIIIVISITLLVDFLLIIFWLFYFKEAETQLRNYPFISIIIAARNEENAISRCMDAVIALDYPKDKMEIIVGNDGSTDRTLDILNKYELDFPDLVKVFDIREKLGKEMNGKANVLAQICRKTKGDVFLFTDADIEVPVQWAKTMTANFRDKIGVVTGFTALEGNNSLAKFQNIDWCFALGIVKVFTDIGRPVTSMGNNMATTREAYEAVGGYENIPFSLTEDMELFKQILKKGYKASNLLHPDILTVSLPLDDIATILKQRKRWMYGALGVPFYMIFALAAQALFFPAIIGLLFYFPFWALLILFAKIFLQATFISFVLRKLNLKIDLKYLFFYEFYSVFLSLSLMVYYIIPTKVEWKGRKY
jgi:cellulose synthase/poly-beta-1,6-N-acetylglucosamine synthase-like glycosyltransferase